MDAPIKLPLLGALVFTVLACAPQPAKPDCVARPNTASDPHLTLKQWALSRCIAKAANGGDFADDASRTAAALLERSSAEIQVYEKLDALVDSFLSRNSKGSVDGSYHTLDCIELFNSSELTNATR